MGGAGIAGAAMWSRVDTRRRWRALVALGVLVGVTAGFALAALAGARRTSTALGRLETRTRAPDAIVFATQTGNVTPDFARLRRRPEVADLAVWDLLFGSINGEPGATLFGSDNGRWGDAIERPSVVKGRMWNPTAPDEVVVDEQATKDAPLGSSFVFQSYAPEQEGTEPTPTGAKVTLHVVGVVRETRGFLFVPDGQVFVGPGFRTTYGHRVLHAPNADVVLRRGGADVAALQRDVDRIVGAGTPVLDLHAVQRRVTTTISVERVALLLLAVVVAIAGGILVAQALIRSAGLVGDDALVLRAVGMTRRDVATASVLSHAGTAAIGGAVAFVVAVVASRWFPVGLARRIDPDVGVHVDWMVVAPGVVATVALVLLASALVGARASALPGRRGAGVPSRFGVWVRGRTPVPVGLGTTMALEAGRGRSRVPVGPALVGAMVGVLGVVATMTIDHGLHDALAHPERAGVTWDLTATPYPTDRTPTNVKPELVDALRRASGGTVAVVDRDLVSVNGVGVPTFAVRPPPGAASTSIAFAVVRGRAPRREGEAVIGPETAREVHARVGERVRLGRGTATVRVVGEGLFPSDVHAEFDQGLWVTPSQLDAVIVPEPHSDPGDRALVVKLPGGADTKVALARVTKAMGTRMPGIGAADVPVELQNLRNVRTLPVVLAGFLALLAIGAVGHVLVTSARRRRHEFAVLRALGLGRRDTRLVLNSQGTVIGLAGLVVGVPLGIALGRVTWRLVTERVPLADVPPLAVLAVVLIVPATVALANVLAVWPGRRAARVRPAEVLRSE